MPKAFEIDPRAEKEATDAYEYYLGIRLELAFEFEQELNEAVGAIAEYPGRAVPHLEGTYRVLLERFPYYVVFFEYPTHLFVVAVAHNRRRPGYWIDRLS